MWKYLLVFICAFVANIATAQENYNINGEELSLIEEVEGSMTLLWNIVDGEYRYFVEKDGQFEELKNTRQDGNYQEEYKETLAALTTGANLETNDVRLVLYSLKNFVNRYNQAVDPNYSYNENTATLQTRIGVFGGVSNNRYTYNPENIMVPVVGLELEFIDPNLALRHSAFVHVRQSFAREDYDYTSTQLSLNYRFKIINKDVFKLHIDTEFASLFYTEEVIPLIDEDGNPTGNTTEVSGFSFQTPLSFGVGTDIALGHNSFLTLSYNDIVSIVLNDNGNFPVDFTVGYKLNL